MSQCGNNNKLALQHCGFCTMWSFVAKGLFEWLPFWAPCCDLAIVLAPLKQIRTRQQTIYSTLHRNFSLSTVLHNILKSFSHFPVNSFEFKTEIWIWYLWEKSSKGTITWSKLEQNKIGDSWNNFFKCEKTFHWYLLGNRRLKSSLADIKYTFIFQIVLRSTRQKGQHSLNYYHIPWGSSKEPLIV